VAKLKVGDEAPDFEKPWTGEGEFKLSDRRGSWVVLAFYPGDATAVCTKQFCSYRDRGEQIEGLDAEVVGISPQGIESHEKFIADNDLNVPLIADQGLEVADAYGIKLGTALRRAVFIVDPEGRIAHRDVKLLGLSYTDADEISKALADAQAEAAAA
jgi:peroxiredoxin Q/BCP